MEQLPPSPANPSVDGMAERISNSYKLPYGAKICFPIRGIVKKGIYRYGDRLDAFVECAEVEPDGTPVRKFYLVPREWIFTESGILGLLN